MEEACLLARSSLPQQRTLALRLLGAVLALSRPSIGRPSSAAVTLPHALVAELEGEGQWATAALEWTTVWHHALHTAEVALMLRRSLDDSHPAVSAAAAEALAALLGAAGPAAAAEEAAGEAADACTLTGWPAPPMVHLQRPTAGGAWMAAPAAPQDLLGGDLEEEGGEEALDERQLSKVDPLSGTRVHACRGGASVLHLHTEKHEGCWWPPCRFSAEPSRRALPPPAGNAGLLQMRVLDRAVYLLATAHVAGAVDPLLSLLIKCGRCSALCRRRHSALPACPALCYDSHARPLTPPRPAPPHPGAARRARLWQTSCWTRPAC